MADNNDKFGKLLDTPDHTPEYDRNDIENNKIMAALSYFSILILIPYFARKNSRYTRFHIGQSLNLIIVGIVCYVLSLFLKQIPGIGPFLTGVLSVFTLFLDLCGIYNAATGKAKELPLVGKYKLIK